MRTIYTVDWLNDDGEWVICQGIDDDQRSVPVAFFILEDACTECEAWRTDTGEIERYRVGSFDVK